MSKGYPAVLNYRKARGQSTKSISKRLGDSFHDGGKVLPVVESWHDNIPNSLRNCDHITPGVLRMIKEDMLNLPDYRLNPKQLWGKAKTLIDGGPTASFAGSIVSQSMDPAYAYTLPNTPPNQWPRNFASNSPPIHSSTSGNATASSRPLSGRTGAVPILSSYHVTKEPDDMPAYGRNGDEAGFHAPRTPQRNTSGRRNHRPMSQPLSSVKRPAPGFSSDGHIRGLNGLQISEGPFHEADKPQRELNTDFKGKEPLRHVRDEATPSHSDTVYQTRYPTLNNSDNGTPPTRYWTEPRSDADFGSESSTLSEANISPSKQWNIQQNTRAVQPGLETDFVRHNQSTVAVGTSKETSKLVKPQDSTQPGFSSQSKTHITKSRSAIDNGPWLTYAAAIEWRRVKKENAGFLNKFKKRPVPKLDGEYLLGKVAKRDHVSNHT
jgi:hypothetical protein